MTTLSAKIDSKIPGHGTKCILVSPQIGKGSGSVELITIVAETSDPEIYIVQNEYGLIFRASRLYMKDPATLESL